MPFAKILSIFLIVVILFVAFFIRPKFRISFTGDEPHYLVMVNSMLKDGDLNLKNDYLLKRYNDYYPVELDNYHLSKADPTNNTSWYSVHGPGLPLLLAPFVFLFGTAKGAFLATTLFALVLLYLVFVWTRRITGNESVAWVCTFILFGSASFLGLLGTVYPDLVIAVFLLSSVLIMETKNRSKWYLILLGLIFGFAPWVHVKTLLIMGTIGIIVIYQILKEQRSRKTRLIEFAYIVFPALLLFIPFELKTYQWYHTLSPGGSYTGYSTLFQLSPLVTLPAMAFDQTKGFFINNPGFFLVFLGIPIWLKRNAGQFLRLLLIIAPTFLIQATFGDWWGGWAPTGRYQLEFIPVFLPAIGLVFFYYKKIFVKLLLALFLLPHFIFGSFFLRGALNYAEPGGANPILMKIQEKAGIYLDEFIPKFTKVDFVSSWDKVLAIIFTTLAVVLVIYGFNLARNFGSPLVSKRRKKGFLDFFRIRNG